MESHLTTIALAIASPAQVITKNTGVSIALVIVLLGASIYATKAIVSTDLRLSNVEESIEMIESQQAIILKTVQNNNRI